MEANFWHQRWAKSDIGFHENEANILLVKYFEKLSLAKGSRLFIPLCGKTIDISWLLSKGYHIAGVELSELAIEQLFSDLGVQPKISTIGNMKHYCEKNIDIFVGDIFDLSRGMLGSVDAIYDRAALVALPEGLRHKYSVHLIEITDRAPQLLISYAYIQNLMEGPPFSVENDEIQQIYDSIYNLIHLDSVDVAGGLKGKCQAKENVWLLQVT